jgi:hypothetical protein
LTNASGLLVVGLRSSSKLVLRAPGSFTSGHAGGFRRQAQRANNKTGLSGVLNLSHAAPSGGLVVHLNGQVGHVIVGLRHGGRTKGVGFNQVGTSGR